MSTPTSTAPESTATWFVIRQSDGHCDIAAQPAAAAALKSWGPFASQAEAIARRVGLIRAGHCQPR